MRQEAFMLATHGSHGTPAWVGRQGSAGIEGG